MERSIFDLNMEIYLGNQFPNLLVWCSTNGKLVTDSAAWTSRSFHLMFAPTCILACPEQYTLNFFPLSSRHPNQPDKVQFTLFAYFWCGWSQKSCSSTRPRRMWFHVETFYCLVRINVLAYKNLAWTQSTGRKVSGSCLIILFLFDMFISQCWQGRWGPLTIRKSWD